MGFREAFKNLLKGWAKQHDLTFIPEYELTTKAKDRRYVDGALLHTLRVPSGFWEARDRSDDLAAEIQKKFKAGSIRAALVGLLRSGQIVVRRLVGWQDVAVLTKRDRSRVTSS